jgi:hypothetical protein
VTDPLAEISHFARTMETCLRAVQFALREAKRRDDWPVRLIVGGAVELSLSLVRGSYSGGCFRGVPVVLSPDLGGLTFILVTEPALWHDDEKAGPDTPLADVPGP